MARRPPDRAGPRPERHRARRRATASPAPRRGAGSRHAGNGCAASRAGRDGREVTSTSKVRGEGSSSVFSSAFWAFVVIECAGDTIADPVAAAHARHAELLAGFPDGIDADRLLVFGDAQPVQVGMRSGAAQRAVGALAAGDQRRSAATAEQRPGEHGREPLLADAFRPMQQQRVRQALARDGRLEARPGTLVPRQQRQRHAGAGLRFRRGASLHCDFPSSDSRLAHTWAATSSTPCDASSTRKRSGSRPARCR